MTMHPFRTAVEARDLEALAALLDENVVFNSPIVYRPYVGREATVMVLEAVIQVFEDFTYDAELVSEDGRTHALMFRARVGDRGLQGCDFLHHAEDGRVDELTVMVRPFSAAVALRDRMAALLTAAP